MIEVTGLTKTYGAKRGISDISFKIKDGEIVGFLGPNGAGKTTTMNIITGYLSPKSGSVKVSGVDILDDPVSAKRHIGYLPEQPPLYLDMTVREYLDFVYDLKGVRTASKKEHISEICESIGISNVYRRVIGNLSKGYRQRVGLAQALVGDPDVLILDEPTVGLDPKQIIEIRNVIKKLGKNRTVILSTHILPEVSAVCERIMIISEGRIIADGNQASIARRMSKDHRVTLRIVGARDRVLPALRSVGGVSYVEAVSEMEPGSFDYILESAPNTDVRRAVFTAMAKANFPIIQMRGMDMSLEDVFIRLTSGESWEVEE